MSKFELTIHVDEYRSDLDPFEEYDPLFTMHSFSNRFNHFTDPDEFKCAKCGHWSIDHTGDPEDEDFAGICQTFTMPEGFYLSYYEHGLSSWSVQGTVHYPDMQWDGVHTAGFLEVTVDDDERKWWDERSDEDKLKAAQSMMEEYTNWINGEVYGYVLESIREETCNLGKVHKYPGETVEDSCWGFIGSKYFAESVREVTESYGATPDNTTVIDKAYGSADYMDLFATDTDEGTN